MGRMTPLLRPRRGAPRPAPADRLVTLIGKPGCHLCDDARAVVAAVCEETGAAWEEKDITVDEELHRRYWEQIPVVLVDGEQHDFWRVDAGRLRAALGPDPFWGYHAGSFYPPAERSEECDGCPRWCVWHRSLWMDKTDTIFVHAFTKT